MTGLTLETGTLIVAIVALVVALLALVLAVVVAIRARRAAGRGDADGEHADPMLRTVLEQYVRRLEATHGELQQVATRTGILEVRASRAVSHVGLVRFNPFEDTGSNQSFALALLDDEQDGVVISSLHSRQSTRLYAKPVRRGRTETGLSTEEAEAIRLAGGDASREPAADGSGGRRR